MRALRRLVPVLWVVFLAALGVRGIAADDARYAWGMFPYVLTYTLDYRWRVVDGSDRDRTVRHKPGPEVKRARSTFARGVAREGWYGLGALTTELRAYARWLDANAKKPAPSAHMEIEVRYRKGPHDVDHVVVITGDARGRGR